MFYLPAGHDALSPYRLSSTRRVLVVRKGTKRDSKSFLGLIDSLAAYENLDPPGRDARRRIVRDVFFRKKASLFVALYGGKHVGYAVYFYTYSTFLGRPTLYLEDIFVLEAYRRKGVGRALFMRCVREAVKQHCGRMEWAVLTWNRSAMEFYENLGGARLDDWCIYRLTSDKLSELAAVNP
jgi:GNAT superfamily N-acetyltransferase